MEVVWGGGLRSKHIPGCTCRVCNGGDMGVRE